MTIIWALKKILNTTPSYLMDWEDNTYTNLTANQIDFFNKYKSLDSFGKCAINAVLEVEFERCN